MPGFASLLIRCAEKEAFCFCRLLGPGNPLLQPAAANPKHDRKTGQKVILASAVPLVCRGFPSPFV